MNYYTDDEIRDEINTLISQVHGMIPRKILGKDISLAHKGMYILCTYPKYKTTVICTIELGDKYSTKFIGVGKGDLPIKMRPDMNAFALEAEKFNKKIDYIYNKLGVNVSPRLNNDNAASIIKFQIYENIHYTVLFDK
jgi:hypothetical protein